MTTVLAALLALTVLPTDRLAMADRLFNKGQYADAAAEYRALKGADGIAEDGLKFRLAECSRVLGDNAAAVKGYEEIYTRWPESRHAPRARFLSAMGRKGVERHALLATLDTDRVDSETRAAALYHLGAETSDTNALVRCVKLAPKGRYAPYANQKYAGILVASADPVERRKGVEVLLGIAFGGGPLADEALYLAAVQSYREKKYGEAGSLFRRYRKLFPNGANAEDARKMSAWSDFLQGRYVDAATTSAQGETDDLAYIRAACAYSTGDNARALELFKKYLEDYPDGQYRADAELPIARIEFDAASAADDTAKTIESAQRSFRLSKLASDQLRLAWAYEKAGKTADAAAEYAKVAETYPKTAEAAEAMYRKAMIDARAENWSAVELALAEALASGQIGSRKASALYWRGAAAMRLGHEAEGVRFLSDALAAGLDLDTSREARLMVADADCRAGRLDAAKKSYAALVAEGACERMSAAHVLSVGKLLEGEGRATCAKALTKGDSAEWRQTGWALLGSYEEAREAYAAAIDAYQKALAEDAKTEELAAASLRLGMLLKRAGRHADADTALKRAVTLNASDAKARASAYLALAENAEAQGDAKGAVAYATIVVSLFDDDEVCAAAKKIVEAHPEAKE